MNTYYNERAKFAAFLEREAFEGLTDSVLRQGLEFLVFFSSDEASFSLEEKDALAGLKVRSARYLQVRLEMALQRHPLSVGCMRLLYAAAESDAEFDALYRRAFDAFTEHVDSLNSSDDEEGDDEFEDDEEGDEE